MEQELGAIGMDQQVKALADTGAKPDDLSLLPRIHKK